MKLIVYLNLLFMIGLVCCVEPADQRITDEEENIEEKPTTECFETLTIDLPASRSFRMGCTSWPYAATTEAQNAVYSFLQNNSDIYAEVFDEFVPWGAYLNNNGKLPQDFENDISSKVSKRLDDHQLIVSASLLNSSRDGINPDRKGFAPSIAQLSDSSIINAYTQHLKYLIQKFSPDYLVMAMEVNELIDQDGFWSKYMIFENQVKKKLKIFRPELKVVGSVTLHNWLNESEESQKLIADYLNNQDLAAISYYPFFNGYHSAEEFQSAFDFLEQNLEVPIAFVETSHLANNLDLPTFEWTLTSSECEQAEYLMTLLENASDYEFVIWWAYRDFDALWETFPDEVKELGSLWRDTGLLDESGNARASFALWQDYHKVGLTE